MATASMITLMALSMPMVVIWSVILVASNAKATSLTTLSALSKIIRPSAFDSMFRCDHQQSMQGLNGFADALKEPVLLSVHIPNSRRAVVASIVAELTSWEALSVRPVNSALRIACNVRMVKDAS